jgi:hypothetical protein
MRLARPGTLRWALNQPWAVDQSSTAAKAILKSFASDARAAQHCRWA